MQFINRKTVMIFYYFFRLNAVNQTFQKKSWLGDKEEGGIRGRYGGRVEG